MELMIQCRECEKNRVKVFFEVDEGLIHVAGNTDRTTNSWSDETLKVLCPSCASEGLE